RGAIFAKGGAVNSETSAIATDLYARLRLRFVFAQGRNSYYHRGDSQGDDERPRTVGLKVAQLRIHQAAEQGAQDQCQRLHRLSRATHPALLAGSDHTRGEAAQRVFNK